MIAVVGAGGYQGRLIARRLQECATDAVLIDRRPSALRSVVAELERRPGRRRSTVRAAVVDGRDRPALSRALQGCHAVISSVAPFVEEGLPVLEAACEAGVPYCDVTAEPAFVRTVAQAFRSVDVPIVPAAGYEHTAHDVAASAAVAALGDQPVDTITTIAFVRRLVTSRGTRSNAGAFAAEDLCRFRDGRWEAAGFGHTARRVDLAEHGRLPAASWPSGEVRILQHHLTAPTIDALYVVSERLFRAAPTVERLSLLLRGLLAHYPRAGERTAHLLNVVSRIPPNPSGRQRGATQWTVVAEAVAGERRATARADGRDIYRTSACTSVAVALRMATDPTCPRGWRAPVEVIGDPARLAVEGGFTLRCDADRHGAAGRDAVAMRQ